MTGALEWRVAAGPNLGASFSLGAGKAVVGSGDAADVILSGQDVKASHLEISIQPGPGGGWIVKAAPMEGRIRIDGAVVERGGALLEEGQILSLGFSALVYRTEGADWAEADLVPLSYAKTLAPEPEAGALDDGSRASSEKTAGKDAAAEAGGPLGITGQIGRAHV